MRARTFALTVLALLLVGLSSPLLADEATDAAALRTRLATTKINLSSQDQALDDVLALLRAQTGINLLIDPRIAADVSATEVTSLHMEDVELDRVLDMLAETAGEEAGWFVRGNTVVLSGRTRDETLCVGALKRWLVALGKKEMLPMLRALSSETGNPFKKMHVRGQKTCWGSHSSTGTISLNYCLMFLDPRHMRYVMIHELCHARHMNHSQRFWRLVGQFEPSYRRLDKDLNHCWKRIPTWLGIY